MIIFIGADHGGWHLKEQLKRVPFAKRITWHDLGSSKLDPLDDYPTVAVKLARRAARSKGRGILICRTGVGVCIVANKVKGVRAVTAPTPTIAQRSRTDEDSNILCLAGEFLTLEQAKKIITAWVATPFSAAARHRRRLLQIKALEK